MLANSTRSKHLNTHTHTNAVYYGTKVEWLYKHIETVEVTHCDSPKIKSNGKIICSKYLCSNLRYNFKIYPIIAYVCVCVSVRYIFWFGRLWYSRVSHPSVNCNLKYYIRVRIGKLCPSKIVHFHPRWTTLCRPNAVSGQNHHLYLSLFNIAL